MALNTTHWLILAIILALGILAFKLRSVPKHVRSSLLGSLNPMAVISHFKNLDKLKQNRRAQGHSGVDPDLVTPEMHRCAAQQALA